MILCWKFSSRAWYCSKCNITFRDSIWWMGAKKLQEREQRKWLLQKQFICKKKRGRD